MANHRAFRWALASVGVIICLLMALSSAQEGPQPIEGEKWALIVGISDYEDPGLRDLRFADNDAQAMYELLTSQAGFPTDGLHTTLLLNEQATKYAIIEALERKLTQAKPDDLVLIYFSGHGSFVEDVDGDEDDGWDETLVPHDAVLGDDGSMIIDDVFGYKIRRIHSKQVIIILDTCYSGGAGKTTNVMGVKGEPADAVVKDLFTTPEAAVGRLLMAASQPHQVSHERKDLQHGLFTYYLLEALRGGGDANRDGAVTAQEAFAYAKEKVEGYVEEQGLVPAQTPLMEDHLARGVIVTYVGCPELVGVVTAIAGGKEQAVEGDRVLIDLGSEDNVQVGDLFEAYREFTTRAGESVREARGKLEVIEVIAEHRSLCEVIESRIPIEVGDKVKRLCEFVPPQPLKPAFFQVAALEVEPPSPIVREEAIIKATIENTGEEKGAKLVELYIDDEREASQEVSLESGEEKVISFGYLFPEKGSYEVEVRTPDDRRSVEVEVQGRPVLEVSPTSLSFSAKVGGSNPSPRELTITNEGGGLLEWRVTTNVDWILPGVNGGSLEAGVSSKLLVFVSIQGLSAGTHHGTVTISAPGAEGSPVQVEVTLTLSP